MSSARILARVLRVTATAVVIGCVLVSTASAQTPVLRWGADAEGGAPFVEADPEHPDRLRGFDVEIAELLAKALGRTPLFVQAAFTALDQSVKRGDFDVAINGLEDSPAKRAELAVSVPYYQFREVLTVRAADAGRFRSLADLRGHKVATLGATLAWEILSAAQGTHGVEPVSYDDDVHPYEDLLNGRVDAVLLDNVLAERSMRRQPGLVTQPEAAAVGYYVVLMAPGETALRDQVNAELRAAMGGSKRSSARGRCGTAISRRCMRACWRAPIPCSHRQAAVPRHAPPSGD